MELSHYNIEAYNTLLQLRRERRISWRAFGLGLVIASYAHKESGMAWPTRGTLSAITGIEMRDISRTTVELANVGFLAIDERDGRANVYRLTLGENTHGANHPMGELPPLGKLPPTLGENTPKPLGKTPNHTNEYKSNNNETTGASKKAKSKKPRLKANEHPTWELWLKVNNDLGRAVPLEEKSSLSAARKLAEQIPDSGEQEQIMRAYLQDKTDTWATRQGLTLSVMVNSRLSKCRTAAAEAIEAQAADDAELIRGAEESFPDPDERADFFYRRQVRGLRVPPGVDCRPMAEDKEAM